MKIIYLFFILILIFIFYLYIPYNIENLVSINKYPVIDLYNNKPLNDYYIYRSLYNYNNKINNNQKDNLYNNNSISELYNKFINYQQSSKPLPKKKINKNTIYDKDIKFYNIDKLFDRKNLHLDDKNIKLYF